MEMSRNRLRQIVVRPLSAEAFAQYGDVVEASANPGRTYFTTSLGNLRPAAEPKLWMLTKLPSPALPLKFESLERHEFSSQTFVPIKGDSWLVVVAPSTSQAGPATDRIEAFLATPKQAVSYRPNTWHGSLTVFGKVARFSVLMWLDGTPADEEIVSVPPFVVCEA
jgi:ureidoglycolate lyase